MPPAPIRAAAASLLAAALSALKYVTDAITPDAATPLLLITATPADAQLIRV